MSQNHYCCRCHRTTKFLVQEGGQERTTYTCTQCGVVVEAKDHPTKEERALLGDPFRSFKTSAA